MLQNLKYKSYFLIPIKHCDTAKIQKKFSEMFIFILRTPNDYFQSVRKPTSIKQFSQILDAELAAWYDNNIVSLCSNSIGVWQVKIFPEQEIKCKIIE